MKKKTLKIVLVIIIVALSFIVGLFWWKNKRNLNENSPGEELRKLMQEPEIKQTWLSHKKEESKTEEIKPDNEKTELIVYYGGNFFVENSSQTYATFRGSDGKKQVGIAVASENPNLQGKGIELDTKLKFKITFFGKDVIKHWRAGRKAAGYWSDYYYFDKNNTNFQLEPLPYQWENSQPLNPAFLGKWKIDLKKTIESGFAKITPQIRQRIEEGLARYFQKNINLTLTIKVKNGVVSIDRGSSTENWGSYGNAGDIFWIKNLDEYSMACFTNLSSLSLNLENNAVLTIFKLDKNKKNLAIYHSDHLVESFGWKSGTDVEKILGWVPWTTNREYNRLRPYFRENAQIFATKIEQQ